MKKLILILLSILFVIVSAIPVSSAAEPSFEVGTVTGKPGDTVEVKVSINNNPGITAFSINVKYSSSDLTLIDIIDCSLFSESLTHSPLNKTPITLSWYSKNSQNIKKNGAFAKLKFKIKNGAKTTALSISYDADNVFDSNFNNKKFKTTNGKVTVNGSSSSKYQLGDVNRDGKITRSDSDLIQRNLAEIIKLDNEQKSLADVSKNHSVSISDATLIQKYCAGIIKKF